MFEPPRWRVPFFISVWSRSIAEEVCQLVKQVQTSVDPHAAPA